MRIDIITIFPDFFNHFFEYSILKRAQENHTVAIHIHDLRKHSTNKQKSILRFKLLPTLKVQRRKCDLYDKQTLLLS